MRLCQALNIKTNKIAQFCLPYSKAKVEYPAYVSEKFDGVYCMAVLTEDNEVHIFSRTGKEYYSMDHLKTELLTLFELSMSDIIIFEAYIPDTAQPIICGYSRDTKHQHTELQAMVHDCLSKNEVIGLFNLDYIDRYHLLQQAFSNNTFNHLHLIQNVMVQNERELTYKANEVWKRQGEGLVIRNPFQPFQPNKRNNSMVKLKKDITFDLQVIQVVIGTGKYQGAVGALICQDGKGVTIRVGTGFTDEQRKAWYKTPSLIKDKIVEVEAMSISSKGVLREPRFKGIRTDKQEVDTIC